MAAANGMSLVWLNMAPYHAPQTLQGPTAAIRPARGPAINRAVAALAATPPIPDQRAKDMTQIVGIDRNHIGERDDNDVEQSAVEVKILEGK